MNIPNEGKILLDFYADWCGPCKAMGKTLAEFQNASEVKLMKIDVDQDRELAQKYGVRGIPCFVFMEDGKIKNRAVGIQTLQQLKDLTI